MSDNNQEVSIGMGWIFIAAMILAFASPDHQPNLLQAIIFKLTGVQEWK